MEEVSVVFLWLAFLLFGAAFAVFLYHLFSARRSLNRLGVIITAVGWSCLTASLVLRGLSAGHVPGVGAYESLTLAVWAFVTIYVVVEALTSVKAVGLYVTPIADFFLGLALIFYEAPAALVPDLKSDLVIVHRIVIFSALGAFFIAGGAAVIYLIEAWQLKKSKHAGPLLGRLPSLATLDQLIYHSILFGLPLLTMTIVTGHIQTQVLHIPHWWTDPLPALALVVWLIYAVFLYGHFRHGWRGKIAARFAIVGVIGLCAIRAVALVGLSNFHNWGQ